MNTLNQRISYPLVLMLGFVLGMWIVWTWAGL